MSRVAHLREKTRSMILDLSGTGNLIHIFITFWYRLFVFSIEKVLGKIKSKKILVFFSPIRNLRLRFQLPDGHQILTYRYATGGIKEIYYDHVYDSAKVKKGAIIFDVGAHVGMYTLKVGKDSSLVVAFEPHPENFNLLISNIRLNRLNNVIPFKCALSDFDGKARLYISDDNGQHSIIENSRARWIEVPVKKISTAMDELGLKEIDVLKIDAEGAELDILKGTGETILNIKQIVCAAYHTISEADKIEDYLSSKGFKTTRIKNNKSIYTYSYKI